MFFLPIVLVSAIPQPIPDPKPVVTPMPNVQVIRNGSPVVTLPGQGITLESGDIVNTRRAEYPARLAINDSSFLAVMPESSLKYTPSPDLDQPDFELIQGQLFYTSFPEVMTSLEQSQPNQSVPPVSSASSRKRLVRTSQRTLGTDGTSFSVNLKSDNGKVSLALIVFHGKVQVFDARGALEKELKTGEFETFDPSK